MRGGALVWHGLIPDTQLMVTLFRVGRFSNYMPLAIVVRREATILSAKGGG